MAKVWAWVWRVDGFSALSVRMATSRLLRVVAVFEFREREDFGVR